MGERRTYRCESGVVVFAHAQRLLHPKWHAPWHKSAATWQTPGNHCIFGTWWSPTTEISVSQIALNPKHHENTFFDKADLNVCTMLAATADNMMAWIKWITYACIFWSESTSIVNQIRNILSSDKVYHLLKLFFCGSGQHSGWISCSRQHSLAPSELPC